MPFDPVPGIRISRGRIAKNIPAIPLSRRIQAFAPPDRSVTEGDADSRCRRMTEMGQLKASNSFQRYSPDVAADLPNVAAMGVTRTEESRDIQLNQRWNLAQVSQRPL